MSGLHTLGKCEGRSVVSKITREMRAKSSEAWLARHPENAPILSTSRCLGCRHQTVLAPDGTAVLIHDPSCDDVKFDGLAGHHSPSERDKCQHCLKIFTEDARHPMSPVIPQRPLMIGDLIQFEYSGDCVWAHLGHIRWNSFKKEVWMHPVEHPNLVLTEADILDWRAKGHEDY